jgi:hypothetical protein
MDFNLPENPTFTQIKTWFESNYNELPKTLQGDGIFYTDVAFTADRYIDLVIHRMMKLMKDGADIRKDRLAKSNKNNLLNLYKDLQNREQWNKKLTKLNKFSNKIN